MRTAPPEASYPAVRLHRGACCPRGCSLRWRTCSTPTPGMGAVGASARLLSITRVRRICQLGQQPWWNEDKMGCYARRPACAMSKIYVSQREPGGGTEPRLDC